MPILLRWRVGDRGTSPDRPEWQPKERRVVVSKVKRLSALIGAILVALSLTLTGCSGGVTEQQKEEKKKEAEKKEKESKEKQEAKEKTQ